VRRFGWSIPLLVLAISCRIAPENSGKRQYLDVRWTGAGRGKITGPATAEWCSPRRLLEIRTVQGDTGIALALYPAETIATGKYRVVDPAKAESLPPAAGVALRWLTQTTVQGFQGDSGVVDLERSASGLLSGRFRIRARSVVDTQRVNVTGTFEDLAVRPESRGCVAPGTRSGEHAEPPDTGVH
jgi:hypothetical protein